MDGITNRKMWNIMHHYEVPDDDWYSWFNMSDVIATVYATVEEIQDFLKKYNKPEAYAHVTTGDIIRHQLGAYEVEVINIANFKPDWSDIDDITGVNYWE